MEAAPLQTATAGYNNALGSLNKSMKSITGSDSSQMMGAQQQLQQNQGRVQQGLINSGLGNTTVAQTMQQAPLQTYNTAVQGIQNNTQHQQMQGYDQLASQQAQGGMSLANLMMAMQNQQGQQAATPNKNPQHTQQMGLYQ